MPALARAPVIARPPSSGPESAASAPLKPPIGVRTAATMQTSLVETAVDRRRSGVRVAARMGLRRRDAHLCPGCEIDVKSALAGRYTLRTMAEQADLSDLPTLMSHLLAGASAVIRRPRLLEAAAPRCRWWPKVQRGMAVASQTLAAGDLKVEQLQARLLAARNVPADNAPRANDGVLGRPAVRARRPVGAVAERGAGGRGPRRAATGPRALERGGGAVDAGVGGGLVGAAGGAGGGGEAEVA